MGVDNTEEYYENFDRIADLFPVVEKALDDGDESVEVKDFMIEELENVYCMVDDLKEMSLIMSLLKRKDFLILNMILLIK